MSQINVTTIQGLTSGSNSNKVILNTNNNDQVIVDVNGRVGIGTTPSNTAAAANSRLQIQAGANSGIFLGYPDSNGYLIRGNVSSSVDGGVLIESVDGTNLLRIDTNGLRIMGGTSYLDDYEEGTWTPGLENYGGTPTTSGKYTKIGNMVYCVCNITLDGTSDTSEFWITDLPFTAASDPAGGGYPLSGTWTANFASSSGYYIRVQPSNTYIQFRNFDGNGAISYNSMGNSSAGSFQFFYHT